MYTKDKLRPPEFPAPEKHAQDRTRRPALQVLLTSIFLVDRPRPNFQAFLPTYSLPSISFTSISVKTPKHVLKGDLYRHKVLSVI